MTIKLDMSTCEQIAFMIGLMSTVQKQERLVKDCEINRRAEYQEFKKYKSHKKLYVPHPSGLVSFWDNQKRTLGPYTTTGILIERYYIHFN